MKKYQVVGKMLELGAGAIELTGAQAAGRMHALKHVKGDVYEITGPVQFKVGEKIGFDGELPKGMTDSLKTPAEIKAEEQAAAEGQSAATGKAQAAMEAQLKAGLEKKLRAEILKDMQAGLVLTLQERAQKARTNAEKAAAALDAEQDPEKRVELKAASLIAEGRFEEANDLLEDTTSK